jgi:LysM repeat protein
VRYGVTVQELKSWNGLSHDALAAGQRVRVTSDIVPVAKAGGRSKRAAATRGANKQSSKQAPAKPAVAVKSQRAG